MYFRSEALQLDDKVVGTVFGNYVTFKDMIITLHMQTNKSGDFFSSFYCIIFTPRVALVPGRREKNHPVCPI